jgi:hypothetical protein
MNAKTIFLLVVCVAIVIADPWDDYKKKFGKKFKNRDEEDRRYQYF